MKPTLVQVSIALENAMLEYRPFEEFSHNAVKEAMAGLKYKTLYELGYDSLDLVEIIMAIEDDIGEYFDDYKLENINLEQTPVAELASKLCGAL